jgi:5-enolpyruvylshikimate-3-phosphate synthase
MAMAIAGIGMDDGLYMDDIECINISFPGFLKTLEGITLD